MMRLLNRIVASAILAVLAASSVRAAAQPATPPPDRKAELDALFASWDRTDSPGCALGVFQGGRILYARGYGMANLELAVANTPATVFDIGSTAKQFAAFSILLLARDGKLSLDDDVRKLVPEIPDYGAPVTIRHLLHHTSGLRDYLTLMDLAGIRDEDLTTDQDALEVIGRQKALNFPPGSEHLYSNSGYFLLSVIVKRASGKSLRDFAGERIFGPLGMTHTQYNDDHTRLIANRATGYSPKEGGGFGISMSDFEQTGDGGILTTVEDLLRWDQNFYEPTVGDRALLAEMQTPGKLANGKPLQYALGLSIGKERGLNAVSHGGAWVGYRAQLLRFPDQHFSVACLCNLSTSNPSRLARKVAQIYLGDKMEKEAAPARPTPRKAGTAPSLADLARLAGTYRDPKAGTVLFLSLKDGKLIADAPGEQIKLDPLGANRFAVEGSESEFRFRRSGEGRPAFEVTEEGEEPQVFEPIEVWKPTAAQLAEFAGSYAGEEVAGTLRFEIRGGGLVVKHRTISADPWKPTLIDSFTEGYRNVTFTRDASGKVDGLKLDAGRVRGLVFRKVAG